MQTVHVAVGVIINTDNQVLIARRASHQHQGNKWEFPGGKVEQGEDSQIALFRELKEELGISVSTAEFLFDIKHHYQACDQHPAKQVVLHIYQIDSWKGEIIGNEGQKISWVDKRDLESYIFPDANKPIVSFYTKSGSFEY